ncbi:MAG TPA: hypothetical protein VEW46_26010 [Pyrinomonadaceae bacterium]|nr:hypothetical protein [Pyrinomonadaceae bacterium]
MGDSNKLKIRPGDVETLRPLTSKVGVDVGTIGPMPRGVQRQEFQKPIAFNGLLTNKILTTLPGPGFAANVIAPPRQFD